MAGGNPILDALRRRNADPRGVAQADLAQFGLGSRRVPRQRKSHEEMLTDLQKFQEIDDIRGGASALAPDDPDAAALAREEREADKQPVTFDEVQKQFEEAEKQLAQADANAKTAREELDSEFVTPKNAAQIRDGYSSLARWDTAREKFRADLAKNKESLATQKKAAEDAANPGWIGARLKEISDGYSSLPEWVRTPVEAVGGVLKNIGGIAVDTLGAPQKIVGATVGELGDVVGGLFDNAAEAKSRQKARDRMAEQSMLEADGNPLVALSKYIGKKSGETTGAVEELATTQIGGVSAANIGVGPVGEYAAQKFMKWGFNRDVTPEQVDRFLSGIAFEISTDPLNFLGTGLYAKGAELSGSVVSKVPLLGKVGRFVERGGIGSQLLDRAPQTRAALELAARAQAIDAVPAFAKLTSAERVGLLEGKSLGKALVERLGGDVQAANIAKVSFDEGAKSIQKRLAALAATDPAAYAKEITATLSPFAKEKFVASALKGAREAVPLAQKMGARSAVVPTDLKLQAELGQRIGAWKPAFNLVALAGEKFPAVAEAATWVRDSFIQRIPLGGPLARAWGAGRLAGSSEKAEVFTALTQYTADIANTLERHGIKANEVNPVRVAARQLAEYSPQSAAAIAKGNASMVQRALLVTDARKGTAIVADYSKLTAAQRAAAAEIASTFHEAADFIKAFDTARGIPSYELVDDLLQGWFGRSFSPEMRQWLALNATAREAMGIDNAQRSAATWRLSDPAARKLHEVSFEGAEAYVRDKLGVPAGLPIFEDEPEKILTRRYAFSANQAAKLRQIDALASEIGVAATGVSKQALRMGLEDDVLFEFEKRAAQSKTKEGQYSIAKELVGETQKGTNKANRGGLINRAKPGQPELIRKVAGERLKSALEGLKFGDPLESATWVRRQLEARGMTVPAGNKTLLELMAEAKAKLPGLDDLDRVIELATTTIPESQWKRYAEIAPGLRDATPESVEKTALQLWDIANKYLRRQVLSSPSSVAKDVLSTWTWLTVAFKSPGSAIKALKDYFRDGVDPSIIKRLEADGVLTTRRTAEEAAVAEARGGKLASFEAHVTEKGLLGTVAKPLDFVPGLSKFKPSEKAAAIPNKLLDWREASDRAARIVLYQERRAAGFSHADAVEDVFKFLGNFNDYASGRLDKKVLQRIFLFWTWNRQALGFGLRGLMEHPMRAKLLFLLTAGNARNDGRDEHMDRWARARGGFMNGVDLQGNPKMISVGAGSFMSPLWGAMNMDALEAAGSGDLMRALGGGSKDVLRMASPLISAPLELGFNRDSFTGAQLYLEPGQDPNRARIADHAPAILNWIPGLKDLFGVEPVPVGGKGEDAKNVAYYRMNPFGKWLMEFTAPGAMAGAQQVGGVFDERRTLGEGALRATTGIPTYSLSDLRPDKMQLKELLRTEDVLERSVADVPGDPFRIVNGRLGFNDRSALGQELAEHAKAVEDAAKERGADIHEEIRRQVFAKDARWLALHDLANRLQTAKTRLVELTPEDATTGSRVGLLAMRHKALTLAEAAKRYEDATDPFKRVLGRVDRQEKALERLGRGVETLEEKQAREAEEERADREARASRVAAILND